MPISHIQYAYQGLANYQESRFFPGDSPRFLKRAERIYQYGAGRLQYKNIFYEPREDILQNLSMLDRCISFLSALVFKTLGLVHSEYRAWGTDYWQQFINGNKKIKVFFPVKAENYIKEDLKSFARGEKLYRFFRELLDLVGEDDKEVMDVYRQVVYWDFALFRDFALQFGDVAPPKFWVTEPKQRDRFWLDSLRHLKKLKNLVVSLYLFKVQDLELLKNLPLKSLTLYAFPDIEEEKLAFLAGMDKLEELRISGYKGEGLRFLKQIKNLKTLHFMAPNFLDKEQLFEVVNGLSLETLSYSGELSVEDIRELQRQNPELVVITVD